MLSSAGTPNACLATSVTRLRRTANPGATSVARSRPHHRARRGIPYPPLARQQQRQDVQRVQHAAHRVHRQRPPRLPGLPSQAGRQAKTPPKSFCRFVRVWQTPPCGPELARESTTDSLTMSRQLESSQPLHSVLATVTTRKRKRGRSVRALEPTGKDLALLKAIADPRFTVGGFCNKDLRRSSQTIDRYVGKTEKQRSGMTTRSLRLLRDHGVIRRLPKSRRYQMTSRGRLLVTALQAALAASTEELMSHRRMIVPRFFGGPRM